MKLPKSKGELGEWAAEVADQCMVSREDRRDQMRRWKAYFYSGTEDGLQALYNRCGSHVDRLASLLFSPVDVRFDIEFDVTEDEQTHAMGDASARFLNREFHRCGVDLAFASGVAGGLTEGANILKVVWGHDGLEPWIVHPQFFGVYNESIDDLDRQEAFVHTSFLTLSQFKRTVIEHPKEAEIIRRVEETRDSGKDEEELAHDYFHQIVIGGVHPVRTDGAVSGQGKVGILGVPIPMLDKKVAADLVRLDELWVQDDDRQDYTTIKIVRPDIVVEGEFRRRNLSGVAGETGFIKICPNEVDGYFWGQSEVAQIYRLQDLLNEQMNDLRRLVRLSVLPPKAFLGFTGMNQERYRALMRPGGFIADESPGSKVENMAPEIPPELFKAIDSTVQYFDDVAGFTPVMMGQGEPGVRAGVHAQTLARNSSPRMRDRALLTERQCVAAGDFCLKLLQEKRAEVFDTATGGKFLLDQLPDRARVTVDSHTASPAFSEDNERKADKLLRAGAIDAADYIALTHPPHEDTLIRRARQRAAARERMMQQHPEMLTGGRKKAG